MATNQDSAWPEFLGEPRQEPDADFFLRLFLISAAGSPLPAKELLPACRKAGCHITGRQLDSRMADLGFKKVVGPDRLWCYVPAYTSGGSHQTVNAPQ